MLLFEMVMATPVIPDYEIQALDEVLAAIDGQAMAVLEEEAFLIPQLEDIATRIVFESNRSVQRRQNVKRVIWNGNPLTTKVDFKSVKVIH